MEKSFNKILQGYQLFREKYASSDDSIMQYLSYYGQQPQAMVVACCDSRVDPALIMQCDPGDLFVVRNVANIIPPFEKDEAHHGTSAALEFGVRVLQVKNLILLGHSQCGGVQKLLSTHNGADDDFISKWVSLIDGPKKADFDVDDYAKYALNKSYQNCLSFPWIKEKIDNHELMIHQWFFDIQQGEIFRYNAEDEEYIALV